MIHQPAAPDDPLLDPVRHVADPGWLCREGVFVAEARLVLERLIGLGRRVPIEPAVDLLNVVVAAAIALDRLR